MRNGARFDTRRLVVWLTSLLIVKVTIEVIWGYRDYFPANFQSDFLRGRESYYFASFRWALYAHLASGPLSLWLGLLLISKKLRSRFPVWHRRLGRVQALNVLLLLVPSGLWMACFAPEGPIATLGFTLLALLTGLSCGLGWRAAVRRRYADHQRWMLRCFLLLCSAVVIRVIGGTGTVWRVDVAWFNPLAVWVSWVVPLAIFETQRIWRAERT